MGVFAILFLKEKLTLNAGVGIVLAVLGTLVIYLFGSFSTVESGSSSLLGNLLIFAAVISEALFIIGGKLVAGRVSPLAISTLVSIFGALLFLPLSIYQGTQFRFEEVSLAEWGLVFYFGIVVTVIAFVLMYQGVSKVPASTAGVLTGVLPISSVIFAVLILGETFSLMHLLGMSCIVVAIYYISKE